MGPPKITASKKSHKAIPDAEWHKRLKRYAMTGVWPRECGIRPGPSNKRWYQPMKKVELCPQTSMVSKQKPVIESQSRSCTCGYHPRTEPRLPELKTVARQFVWPKDTESKTGIESTDKEQPGDIPVVTGTREEKTHMQEIRTTSAEEKSDTHASGSVSQTTKKKPVIRLPSLNPRRFDREFAHMFKDNPSATIKPNLVVRKAPTATIAKPPSAEVAEQSRPQKTELPTAVPSNAPATIKPPERPGRSLIQTGSILVPPIREKIVANPEVAVPQAIHEDARLPQLWPNTIPEKDHKWILRALFTRDQRGKLQLTPYLKLWFGAPQPPLVCHQVPVPETYYRDSVFVWMPFKMWGVHLTCPEPDCKGAELRGAGLHKRARQVLDIDRYYSMVTETVRCPKCNRRFLGWGREVMSQLDLGHRSMFPALLTSKYACDFRVVRMLRERGIGNSTTRLKKQLQEQHSDQWLRRTARYLTMCKHMSSMPGIVLAGMREPLTRNVLPTYKWLLTVYRQDIVQRLDSIKAQITSQYGTVLKMDSSKKITKKLTGACAGTALWATSVGNERGEVLNTVMTATEGSGLEAMCKSLVRRYEEAHVPPPSVLYVDRDCCAQDGIGRSKSFFAGWPQLKVKLDIWHFMRRIAAGCNTDAHQLYGPFMTSLSNCIFEFDPEDLQLLLSAKASELESQGLVDLPAHVVQGKVTRRELKLHCKRRTRGVDATREAISTLLQSFSGSNGQDTLGVPLFDERRMEKIWAIQQRHLPCIQDPEGVPLYTETGTLRKGTKVVKTYRCARGSTSLESYHLHLNRFIPGTSAGAVHFQAYLLDGIARWNEDRGAQAVKGAETLKHYNVQLLHAVNTLSEDLFAKKMVDCQLPGKYTGELIGLEYLFKQTGRPPLRLAPDSVEEVDEDAAADESEVGDPELQGQEDEDEGIDIDADDDPTLASTLERPTLRLAYARQESEVDTSTADVNVEMLQPERTATPTDEISVDDHYIPGYDKVDKLVTALLPLAGNDEVSVSPELVTQLVALWEDLEPYDKARSKYPDRHKKPSGRFKASKAKSGVAPGVESTKRLFFSMHGEAAQWPNLNRIMETLCFRLCKRIKSPTKTEPRFSQVQRLYNNIRDKVMQNAELMRYTDLQLAAVNNTTLSQWYNKRMKTVEQNVLLQGVDRPQLPVSSERHVEAAELLECRPAYAREPLSVTLPADKTGMTKARRRSATIAKPPTSTTTVIPPLPSNHVVRNLEHELPPTRPQTTAMGPEQVRGLAQKPLNSSIITQKRRFPSIAPMPPTSSLSVPQEAAPLETLIYQLSPLSDDRNIILEPIRNPTPSQVPVVTGNSSTPITPSNPDTQGTSSTTAWRHKKREQLGQPPVKKYKTPTCKKCGKPRTALEGHSNYKGAIYCPSTTNMSREDWLATIKTTDA